MLCFAAMTIKKAEIFMPEHKLKHKFFVTRRFPNLSNNQNGRVGVFMKMPAVSPGRRCTL